MTKTRQILAGIVVTAALVAGMCQAGGTVNFRYWTNATTGMAINGYDPVAYFVQREPVQGRSPHELVWRGVAWRFVSAANRAAFEEAPEVYAPQYGGYSVVGVARGYPSEGNPHLWAIEGQRLYLFHSVAHKALWEEDPQGWIEKAREKWPEIERHLAP